MVRWLVACPTLNMLLLMLQVLGEILSSLLVSDQFQSDIDLLAIDSLLEASELSGNKG